MQVLEGICQAQRLNKIRGSDEAALFLKSKGGRHNGTASGVSACSAAAMVIASPSEVPEVVLAARTNLVKPGQCIFDQKTFGRPQAGDSLPPSANVSGQRRKH